MSEIIINYVNFLYVLCLQGILSQINYFILSCVESLLTAFGLVNGYIGLIGTLKSSPHFVIRSYTHEGPTLTSTVVVP